MWKACNSSAIEVALWLVALFLGVTGVLHVVEARAADTAARAISMHDNSGGLPKADVLDAELEENSPGQVIARLQIPQIKLSVPVLESYNPETLMRGVGHIPGTALPGGLGNLVLVGHRDTFFRALKNIQPGMKVEIATLSGKYRYIIESTEIVTPDKIQVLESGRTPGMTLITCYPFEFLGSAPKRFIVYGSLVSLDPG